MEHDPTFRWILIAAFAVVLPIGLYHRIRSQASGEKLDRRQEGLFILLTLRPVGLLKMLGVIAWLIHPPWMAWSSLPLPVWLRWCGVGVGVLTAALIVWVFRSIGTNITDTVVTRRDHELITCGPYRWIRHPLYTAMALAVIADSLVIANWYLALMGAAAFGLIVLRTAREEENLVARFGDDYRRYVERTGRFLPRIG